MKETGNNAAVNRERIRFDEGWRFHFGHPMDPAKDFGHGTRDFSYFAKAGFADGPAALEFEDRDWRGLDLPHDWAVELPFSPNAGHSHGFKALGMRFPETSVAWYRKTFALPESDFGRKIWIEFDGIFRDAKIWVNGFYCGSSVGGYLGFRCDVTEFLNYGGRNLVAVRVDARMEEGWFYEGAGIYRHVWLDKFQPIHADYDSLFAQTEIIGLDAASGSAERASVRAEVSVINGLDRAARIAARFKAIGPDGAVAAVAESEAASLEGGDKRAFVATLTVEKPALWSLESRALYRLEAEIFADGQSIDGAAVDAVGVAFGVREARFEADTGFWLNGKNVKLLGSNNHQDHAGVGTAIPDGLQDFRVKKLKEFGSNAYRCSHNPPTKELLDACDREGLLVIDENRLMGVTEQNLEEVRRMIERDRNHPSVILWSLGNEEWAIEGNEKGARIAKRMQEYAQRLDPTRRYTVAISGGWGWGISTTIDVMGYNYVSHGSTDDQHKKFPQQPGVGTEETTNQGTRGVYFDDRAHAHMAELLDGTSGGNAELGWKHYAERPYLAGLFYWTGFDYRGEPVPLDWPAVLSQFGILDTCGFPKDCQWYLKSMWVKDPMVHIAPHWNWAGREGQEIPVKVYSNQEEVELFLNGVSLGKRKREPYGHLEWQVAYAPGSLRAVAGVGGKIIVQDEVQTTKEARAIRLSPDAESLRANGADVAIFSVEALDEAGRHVPIAQNLVEFTLEGDGKIIGVGNGDPGSHEPDVFVPAVRGITVGAYVEMDSAVLPEAVSPKATPPEAERGYRDYDWHRGFVPPYWAVDVKTLPKPPAARWYRATFSVPDVAEGERASLCLTTWCDSVSLWVNGIPVASCLKRQSDGHVIELPLGLLQEGPNQVTMLGAGLGEWRERYPDNFSPVHVRLERPAGQWKRRLFNGWAQVIVQAGKRAGTLKLSAYGDGLTACVHEIKVK
jgi:beta-galactosidase